MLQVTPPCRIAVGALLLKMACVFFKILCSMGSLSAVRMLLDKRRENTRERRDSIGGGGWGGGIGGGGAVCDVNAYSGSGSGSYSKCTALHIATRHRHMEIVKLLLQVPCPSPRPPPPSHSPPSPISRTGHMSTPWLVTVAVHLPCVCSPLLLRRHKRQQPQLRVGEGAGRLGCLQVRLDSSRYSHTPDSTRLLSLTPCPSSPPPLQLHPLLQSSPLTVAV